ncbi:MAG: CPBP family intramembrane metalloprotease [Xylanivirga thermophila]|jgi:uncharacterized protein|uniref:CPBP family intramembrane glutamic endopeptidase n=1 Tax=Xylanivirga thermophila TaxID=2496273 RepID=UPI0039F51D60
MRETRYPSVLASSILYLVVLLLMIVMPLLFSGQIDMENEPILYYIMTFSLEVTIIGLPPLIYLLATKKDVKEVARFNPLTKRQGWLVVGMAVFGYCVIIFINIIWLWLLSFIGTPTAPPSPPVENLWQYLLGVICVGAVPAFVEEFLFRGVILRGYENIGRTAAVVLTGILFALLHMSVVTLPAIILLGIVISYVVQKSNSIWAGFIYHFTNNTIAVTATYIQSKVQGLYAENEIMMQDISKLPKGAILAGIGFWAIIAVLALWAFISCFKSFNKETKGTSVYVEEDGAMVSPIRWSMVDMMPVIVAVIIVGIFIAIEILGMRNGFI